MGEKLSENTILDSASASTESAPVIVTGESVFEKLLVDSTMAGTHMVEAADFDSDGDVDIVSTALDTDTVAWFENDGTQSFTKRVIDNSLEDAYPASVADVDMDGDIDVLAGGYRGDKFVIYDNDGSGTFTTLAELGSNGPHSVFSVDMDGDGDNDLLTSSQDAHLASWYENDGSENFNERQFDTDLRKAKTAVAVDLDQDGDLDVIGTSNSRNTIYWYENDGAQSFTRFTVSGNVKGAYYAIGADLDGDGDIDIASVGQRDDSLSWHVNDGAENFSRIIIDNTVDGARAVAASDIDADGDIDLVATARDANSLNLYFNNGDGTFDNAVIDANAAGVYGTSVSDVDGDGVLDVLAAANESGEIAVHLQSRAHEASVELGASLLIDTARLQAVDSNTPASGLIYTVLEAPLEGDLQLNTSALVVGDTFSQAQIDAGLLSYKNASTTIGKDGFSFSVSDGSTAFAPARGSFSLDVVNGAGSNQDPVITSAAAANVAENSSFAIDVNASDGDGDTLTYDISGGTDAALFTIDDSNGILSFVSAPDFEAPADANGDNDYEVEVTVDDANGGGDTQFITITVTDANEDLGSLPTPIYDAPGDMVFDGTKNSILELPHASNLQVPSGTVALGFTAVDLKGGQGLFSKDAKGFVGGGNHLSLYLQGSTLIARFQNGEGGGNSISIKFPGILAGIKYDIAASFGPNGSKLYVDGVEVGSNPLVMNWSTNVEYFQWGGLGQGSDSGAAGATNPLEGTISNKQIYGVALSSTQIADLHHDGGTVPNQDPVITSAASANVAENSSFAIDVEASDGDGDPLGYGIFGGADAAFFTIDGGTGELSFVNAPDFEAPGDANGDNDYQVEVTVDDSNGGSDSQSITVTVTDVNEDLGNLPPPVFEQSGVKTYNGNASVDNYAPDPALKIPEGTIAFSFIDDKTSVRQGLIVKDASGYSGGGNHFAAYIEKRDLKVRFQDGTNEEILVFEDILANTEYEVAATFSSNGSKLYVDGQLEAETDLIMNWTSNQEWLQVGGLGWGSATGAADFTNPFSGQITDVQIYDQVLEQSDVGTLASTSSFDNII